MGISWYQRNNEIFFENNLNILFGISCFVNLILLNIFFLLKTYMKKRHKIQSKNSNINFLSKN